MSDSTDASKGMPTETDATKANKKALEASILSNIDEDREKQQSPKSLTVAYLLFFCLPGMNAHNVYLGRYHQAFFNFFFITNADYGLISFLSMLFDFFCMPYYVKMANSDPELMKDLAKRIAAGEDKGWRIKVAVVVCCTLAFLSFGFTYHDPLIDTQIVFLENWFDIEVPISIMDFVSDHIKIISIPYLTMNMFVAIEFSFRSALVAAYKYLLPSMLVRIAFAFLIPSLVSRIVGQVTLNVYP